MGIMVYIACDGSLPTIAWDKDKPGFHVTSLPKQDEMIRRLFSKLFVYYAGSHEGCGCGFQFGEYPESDPGELASAKHSRWELVKYLSREVRRHRAIELYACWDGDQSEPPVHFVHLRPADLVQTHTYFREREFITVTATLMSRVPT
jgi:hypothetical protein